MENDRELILTSGYQEVDTAKFFRFVEDRDNFAIVIANLH